MLLFYLQKYETKLINKLPKDMVTVVSGKIPSGTFMYKELRLVH